MLYLCIIYICMLWVSNLNANVVEIATKNVPKTMGYEYFSSFIFPAIGGCVALLEIVDELLIT